MSENKDIIENARNMRSNMTEYEFRLWIRFLSKYPVRFKRQKVIDNYIVDFFCFRANLIVEIDGSHHYEDTGVQYDNERTRKLNELGYDVLRFSNLDIAQNFSGVCDTIDMEVRRRINPPKSHK